MENLRNDEIPQTYIIMKFVQNSVIENEDVCLEQYLSFWTHVCKIMESWGTIFGFVVKDVNGKLRKLVEMRENSPEGYKTILSMATEETRKGTIRKSKPHRSGTGHLIVLNRALEFVVNLLDGVFKAEDPSAKVSEIAKTAYSQTLSKYHSWPIRTCVSAALYTLPYKNEFLTKLRGSMPITDDEKFHSTFDKHGREIINRVNNLVANFQLLDYDPSA